MSIDGEDFTYPQVGAAQLLKQFVPQHGAVIVEPPANTQTLVLVTELFDNDGFSVTGQQSGIPWSIFPLGENGSIGSSTVFVCPISTVVDQTYEIAAPGNVFVTYVVAEQGIRAIADCTLQSIIVNAGEAGIIAGVPIAGVDKGGAAYPVSVDALGQLQVVAVAPTTAVADQPQDEIEYITIDGITANTNILAAPGANKSYRLFYLSAWPETGTAEFDINVTSLINGSVLFCKAKVAGIYPPVADLPATGFLCRSNTAVELEVSAGTAGATVGYQIVQ